MSMSSYYQNLRDKVGAELLFMPSVAAVVRNEEDHILFIRKGNEQTWGLPAGAIEIGETPAQAITREVYEETGLTIQPTQIIGVFGGEKYQYQYSNGHQVEYLVIVFQCSIISGKLEAKDAEAEQLSFFNESEIPNIAIPYPKEIFLKNATEGKTIFE
ncbi:NUDIX domain-containing protein [Paenibacillus sp. SC116]|uniref:NUDIX domain-containing protein n=1 Tax=Paenibacillus sp. SC116 TaxID=2968986 RepID=UPI00215A595D|nr:NUDIX domain-containing protein [Paenibacillus sp. SC116]MCR8843305.1 NUDIX domain-containing protein [Paenibacillus sp. SC116]